MMNGGGWVTTGARPLLIEFILVSASVFHEFPELNCALVTFGTV